jgi:hypothetical protein
MWWNVLIAGPSGGWRPEDHSSNIASHFFCETGKQMLNSPGFSHPPPVIDRALDLEVIVAYPPSKLSTIDE